MKAEWYYSDELSPSDELVDKFADSKFGINKWSSFAREIIQNSLDAQDDEGRPVEVAFDLNRELALKDIPGGMRIKEILGYCMEAATNEQTKRAYEKGLKVLSKEKVYCLKISDRNTRGVKTGRDEAWGALVFDEGKSVKQRPGSAGSHGVGKKVPFIISSCNTVFYATKNKYKKNGAEKSDCLLQGKTMLINWSEPDGTRKSSKGWYGVVDENSADSKNKIRPIDASKCRGIHPYFVRKEEFGTDVIIVGVNLYENEQEIKEQIISAVLENFFVAILRNKLTVNVFGEQINCDNFENMTKKYYRESSETKNSLVECLRVFDDGPHKVEQICDRNGNSLGEINLYFGLGNEHNKKYYTVVRSHGMKITDYRVNKASQPYTAVVLVEGKRLNHLLSSLENAAHDSFVTKDENMEMDAEAVWALEKIQQLVKEYVTENTRIDETQGQEIESLNNIISIPGIVPSIRRKAGQPVIRRNVVSRRGKASQSKDYQGRSGFGGGKGERKHGGDGNKPAQRGNEFDGILYENYELEPIFIKKDNSYVLKLEVRDDIGAANIKIRSVNSEGRQDSSISDYVESVWIAGKRRKCADGKVVNVKLAKKRVHEIIVKLKKDITYQLTAEIYLKEAR